MTMDDKFLVGYFHSGTDGPQVWLRSGEGDFVITLTMRDAWELSTLIDQSILACINSQCGGVN